MKVREFSVFFQWRNTSYIIKNSYKIRSNKSKKLGKEKERIFPRREKLGSEISDRKIEKFSDRTEKLEISRNSRCPRIFLQSALFLANFWVLKNWFFHDFKLI